MNKREIYRQVTMKRAKGVRIGSDLCFYSTREILECLRENKQVRSWLKFVSNHYVPQRHDVLLIYPCSADKPYSRSRSYVQLNKTLSRLGDDRQRVHVATISEPFGLVPEEFYNKKTRWHDWKNGWYDCPGLFEWWCRKYGRNYSADEADKCIEILAGKIALFLRKVKKKRRYRAIIAFVRNYSSHLKRTRDQTHRRMIERAAKMSNVNVRLMPSRELVSSLVRRNGKFAWDMYGVSHPYSQAYLLKRLRAILRDCN
jgi:archaeosine synthase